jgi:hypothetical protein
MSMMSDIQILPSCTVCGEVNDHKSMFGQGICFLCRKWYYDVCSWIKAGRRLAVYGQRSTKACLLKRR